MCFLFYGDEFEVLQGSITISSPSAWVFVNYRFLFSNAGVITALFRKGNFNNLIKCH